MNCFDELAKRETMAGEQSCVNGAKGKAALSRTQDRLSKVDTRTLNENGLKNYNQATVDALWIEGAMQAYEHEVDVKNERIQYQSKLIRQMLTLHKISELEKQVILSEAQAAAKDLVSL